MWVVDIIENCITLWNSTLSSIWSMLTQSPETFHNGAVWDAITKIFTALQGAGYGLLVLFFAMSFFKHTVSFREFRHPEQIIGYLIRFVAAKVLISQGMDVIKLIFKISGGLIGACMEAIVIVIACIIFNAFTSVDGSDFPINFGDSGVGLVLTYMLKVIIQMVILGSMVKAADKTVKEMFAL